jgi:hypothetical protein
LGRLVLGLRLLVTKVTGRDGIVPVTAKAAAGTSLVIAFVACGDARVDIFKEVVRAGTDAGACQKA